MHKWWWLRVYLRGWDEKSCWKILLKEAWGSQKTQGSGAQYSSGDALFRPNHVNRLSTIITYAFLQPSFFQSLFRNFLKFCHHKSVGDPSRFFFSVWSIVCASHFCRVPLSPLGVLLRKLSLPTMKLSKSPNFLHLHFFQQSQPITICGATTGQNHGFFACFSLARRVKGMILGAP